jgi:hypothetical protein
MTQELTHLAYVLITAFNDRDFHFSSPKARNFVKKHISPDWQSRFDNEPYTITFAEQTEVWREITAQYPDFYIDVLDDIDVVVHKDRMTADTIIRSYLTGQNGVVLQGVCEMKWKLRDGRWMCWYHHAMKGLREV